MLIAALLYFSMYSEYRRTEQQGFDTATNIATLTAEYTASIFDTADQGLAGIAGRIVPERLDDPAYALSAHEILGNALTASPSVFAYFIIGRDGISRLSSRAPAIPPVDFSGQAVYRELRSNPQGGLYISDPLRGLTGTARGRWIMHMGLPLFGRDGAFAGVVAAAISVDALREVYSLVRVGPNSILSLIHHDGHLIVTSPYREELVGLDISNDPVFRANPPVSPGGTFRAESPIEGMTRLSAYRVLSQRPFIVYVGLSTNDVFAQWRVAVIRETVLAAILAIVISLLSWALAQTAIRWRKAVRANRRRLDRLVNATRELVSVHEMHRLLPQAASLCRELIGAHMCVIAITPDGEPIHHVASLSERYAQWNSYGARPTGAGIYRLVVQQNRPFRMTQADLEAHPDWLGFGPHAAAHPPMRGWLAVPLRATGGGVLGLIQMSDRYEGEFSASDEAILMQAGQVVAAAIQNINLLEAVDATRREAERTTMEAERARDQIEAIFTSMSDAFFSVDRNFRFTYLNRRAEVLLLRKAADLIGRNLWESFPEARETVVWKTYNDVMETRQPAEQTFYYEPLQCWFNLRAYPHDNGMAVYFRDVTKQRQIDEQLREAQKMEAIGQLTGGVAHDFNNLLTVILGNTDMLLRRLAGDERLHRHIELIHAAAEKAADLTRSLLAFARRQVLAPEASDIDRKLHILRPLLHSVLEPGMTLEVQPAGNLPPALIDRPQFDTAVLNLVINARDAMPDGGRITVATGIASLGAADIAKNPDALPGQYVTVSVRDTGTGMTPEVKAKAFEPFFTTKEVGRGTGLGLSMVYGFIRQSHGHVAVESEPGVGTTVTLYFPCADGAG